MHANRPSRTAEYNALFRALDRCGPCTPQLVDDPFARHFLSPALAAVATASRVPRVGSGVTAFIDRRWPGVRTALMARTRLIDGLVNEAARAGADQLVILGAGFDSRPYRLNALADTAIFEVDHPSTQARKRGALARTLGAIPPNVRFVATDFDLDDLGQAMAGAGYRANASTAFLWEGVSGYLTAAAVDKTLSWCATAATSGAVIFTYLHEDVLSHPEHYVGTNRLRSTLRNAHEPLTFGLRPETVPGYLEARGLRLESDVGAEEYRRRYYGDLSATMHGHEFYRVALATRLRSRCSPDALTMGHEPDGPNIRPRGQVRTAAASLWTRGPAGITS